MDAKQKAGRFYLMFFGLVCLLFIGILAYTYRLTRRASIVMLDERGRELDGHGHGAGRP